MLAIHFLNLYPNYLAWKKTPPGYNYSGQISWLDPWDINVYVAAISWGQQGNFLLKNRYTSLEHQPSLVYPLYTSLGLTFPKINPFLLFHLTTLITGSILFLCLFLISSCFFSSSNESTTTYNTKKYSALSALAISLAGGLGWVFKHQFFSADVNNTAFSFHSAFQRPHDAIGTCLYLLSLFNYFLFLKSTRVESKIQLKKYFDFFIKYKHLIFATFSSLLLIIFFPYYLLNVALIIGFLFFYQKQRQNCRLNFSNFLPLLASFALTTFLTVLYLGHLKSTGFASVAGQKLNPTRLLGIILGYGIVLPIAIGSLLTAKKLTFKQLFLASWFIISLLTAFIPFGFSIFYLRALFAPLIIIIFSNIKQIWLRNKRLALLLLNCFLLFLPLSTFFIFFQRIADVPNTNNFWLYQKKEIFDAFNYLNQQPKKNVLSYYTLGNYLPAHTNKSAVFGHLIQTPDVKNLTKKIKDFYANKLTEEQAKNFLSLYRVNYVIFGYEEQKLGAAVYPFLKEIYKNSEIIIYEY